MKRQLKCPIFCHTAAGGFGSSAVEWVGRVDRTCSCPVADGLLWAMPCDRSAPKCGSCTCPMLEICKVLLSLLCEMWWFLSFFFFPQLFLI